MYPQQHHHVPFTNIHQPYYSANGFSSSLPLTSDSSLHPPGTYPLANSNLIADSHNWIVKHADPIRYDPAVGSSQETLTASSTLPSTWNDTWSHQSFTNAVTVILPNQTEVHKPMRCEVCKVDCNSNDVYEKHIQGKKHKRKLQVQTNPTNTLLAGPSKAIVQSNTSSVQGEVLIGPVPKDLESKKRKLLNGGAPLDSVKVCKECNIVCNSEDVFKNHLAGKKHAAQVRLMCDNGIGPHIAAFKRQGIGPWKKAPEKKAKVVQSVWCEVCKITCNTRDVYIGHLAGKKHLKNLEKQSKPKVDSGASATTATPMIGPPEKPGTDKPKPNKAPEIDIETKKRKVVEGGAAEAEVRLCTLCNVVCNSQTVFNTHLAGHKHAAMVKKHGESKGVATA